MKKVISFSLWGNIKLYTIGTVKNAILAKKIYKENKKITLYKSLQKFIK